jgi:CheY-like chemotaxis protein
MIGHCMAHKGSMNMTEPTSILVIEDTEAIAEMLSLLLTRHDRMVVHAANGQVALSYLDQSTALPALILLDLQMPIMDGWAFYAAQCEHPTWRYIPVVVMSAVADKRRLVEEMPGVVFLPKPLDPARLVELVDQYTDRYHKRGESV